MTLILFLIAFFALTPAFIIYLTSKSSIANKIGSVIIAYGVGLVLGNCGLLPKASEGYREIIYEAGENNIKVNTETIETWLEEGKIEEDDKTVYRIEKLQDIFTGISILLAIPLLLFSMNVVKWFRMAGKTLISMLLAIISVSFIVIIGYLLVRNRMDNLWKIAGMLVGLYSGGTPNLAALKMALDVDPVSYIMTHTYDTLITLIYLLFLLSFGKYVFRAILPAYPANNNNHQFSYSENGYEGMFHKNVIKKLITV